MKFSSIRILAFALSFLSLPVLCQTRVTEADFGRTPEGENVTLYTLADAKLTVKVMTFGAHVTSVMAPDRTGKVVDVVLGYDSMAGYVADDKSYMGAVVGRYGNRIAKGRFPLDGEGFTLSTNNKGNTLHGGVKGFDRYNWKATRIANGVEFSMISKDGDQGFPGTLTAHVRYTLLGDQLRMDYSATTDKATVVNLTNHSYFNLAGSGDVLAHVVQINGSHITAVDAGLIPTGDLPGVAGTPFDFLKPAAIGARIDGGDEQLKLGGGYDHNWVLDAKGSTLHEAAKVVDPASGRMLVVATTEPGVQFYSGNFLDGSSTGRSGFPYNKHFGFCLETQHFPDSPNHPNFPSTTLRPGQVYRSSTTFQFAVAP